MDGSNRDTLYENESGQDLGDILWEAARYLSEEAGIISSEQDAHPPKRVPTPAKNTSPSPEDVYGEAVNA